MALITYDDKVAINENASIPDINKVNASDMNEIKNGVNTNETSIGDLTSLDTTSKTSCVNAINELKNAEVYSTNEVKTNKVWIDNKPIYRKVFTRTGTGTIDISGLSIDTAIIDYGHSFCKSTSDRWTSVVSTTTTTSNTGAWQISVYINSAKTTITIEKGTSAYVGDVYITLEYTKTTD